MERRFMLMLAAGAALALAAFAAWYVLHDAGILDKLADERALRAWVQSLGPWGPLAIVGLMTAAIVMTPIPSAPIALVAGAAYGPLWGTIWIVAGAEAGAIVAFWIARCLGYEALRRWARVGPWLDKLSHRRSQWHLTWIVFASRMVPFVSFDLVSYAAGLTPLAFWRFAAATLAGVVPVSFALAYFGEALSAADPRWALLVAAVVGAGTLVPFARKIRRRSRPDH